MIIRSTSYSQDEIIQNIINLHTGPIELDPTYSKGYFYKKIQPPRLKFDLVPQTEDTVQASADKLPLEDESVGVIMFDPPFCITGGPSLQHPKPGSNIIPGRFGGFKTPDELTDFYFYALKEFKRILRPGGWLIFKCQDTVSSSRQYWTHCFVLDTATFHGFYPKDLFILLAKSRLTDKRKQQHARKYHCYFWVFQKSITK